MTDKKTEFPSVQLVDDNIVVIGAKVTGILSFDVDLNTHSHPSFSEVTIKVLIDHRLGEVKSDTD